MGYVVDRNGALRADDLVMVLAARARGVRSQVLLRDGSLYRTLTRPRRFAAALEDAQRQGYCVIGRKGRRNE